MLQVDNYPIVLGTGNPSTSQIAVSTPVNAVAATLPITIGTVPADYVANVQSARTYTVAVEPAVNVFSTLETALVGDNNDLLFTSKTLGVAGNYVEIIYTDPGAEGSLSVDLTGTGTAIDPYIINVTLASTADPAITTTASDIKTLIEADEDVNALVRITYPALNDGTGIVTALAQTPLANGVDATILVIGTDTYTFVDSVPGVLEILVSGTTATCAAIAALSPLTDVEIVDNLDDTFTITALFISLPGTAGDGYAVTPDGVYITGDANLANGVDEVLESTTLNSIQYIYYDSAAGDDPTVDYPSSVPVDTAATKALTADKLATAIATDADMASAVAVGAVVTATWGVKGVVGNAIAFTDGTDGDVTAAATMSGGVDGTPGYKGQVYHDEANKETWTCNIDNYTETQDSWYNTANSASIALKQDRALTGQAAPTTATVGQLGDVIFDTDGKCWMLRKVEGSIYSWERLFTDIVLTQTEYDAIVTKDPNVRYMIVGA